MYEENKLAKYIEKSEIRELSKNIKIRMSKEIAQKYDKGLFSKSLNRIQELYNKIKEINIKYPGNADPVLYIYIVPKEKYSELLKIPAIFDKGTGGGKPIKCFDLDGYNEAYGISENLLENKNINEGISKTENETHELSHIVQSQFCYKNAIISEGFAEMLALYILDMEKDFTDYKKALASLKDEDIYTAKELLNSERDKTFGTAELIPNRTCSFRLSYISSYLFIRGCIKTIEKNKSCSKIDALNNFLRILRNSTCTFEWLIFDIANSLKIDKEQLLNGKELQLCTLKEILNDK